MKNEIRRLLCKSSCSQFCFFDFDFQLLFFGVFPVDMVSSSKESNGVWFFLDDIYLIFPQ